MNNPPSFEVFIHESKKHEPKGRVVLPVLPTPGLFLIAESGSWEVLKVQLLCRGTNSLAEKHGDPHMVMVIAKEHEGSFFD